MRKILYLIIVSSLCLICATLDSVDLLKRVSDPILQLEILKNGRLCVLTEWTIVVIEDEQIISEFRFPTKIEASWAFDNQLAGASMTYLKDWDRILVCSQGWIECATIDIDYKGYLSEAMKATDIQIYLSEVAAFIPVSRTSNQQQPVIFTQLFRVYPDVVDSRFIPISGFNTTSRMELASLKFSSNFPTPYIQRTGLNYSMLPHSVAVSQIYKSDLNRVQSHSMKTLLSFNPGNGFVYFVRSRKKLDMYLSHESRKYNKLQVVRICQNDTTSRLYSSIELSLVCGDDYSTFWNEFNTAAVTYDDKLRRIITMSNNADKDRLKMETRLCYFDLDRVDAVIDASYASCQNETNRDRMCVDMPTEQTNYDCVWRNYYKIDHSATWCNPIASAEFYNYEPYISMNLALPPQGQYYPICGIVDFFPTNIYEFGLEQVNPLRGVVISKNKIWDKDNILAHPITSIIAYHQQKQPNLRSTYSFIVFNTNGDLFRLGVDGGETKILNSRKSHLNYRASGLIVDNKLIFSDKNQILSHALDCGALYSTCKSVLGAVDRDPLECVWCTNKQAQQGTSVPKEDCDPRDSISFTNLCPPSIHKVVYDQKEHVLIMEGANLHSMSPLELDSHILYVCDKPCFIHDTSAERLACKPEVKHVSLCEYSLIGKVGNVPINMTGDLLNDIPGKSIQPPGPSNKQLMYIAVGLLILVAVISCVGFVTMKYRRKGSKKQPASRLMHNYSTDSSTRIRLDPATNTAGYLNPRRANSYDGNEGERVNQINYREILGDLMKEVPPNLFLPENKVVTSKLVGNGHYGVVYQGEYTNRDDTVESVAVKSVLDARNVEGVAEFLREGLRMEPFDHSHVLKLTGIYFSKEGLPRIVTPFMSKGDLLNFIRKEDNNEHCTLRGLIQFACQIADGLAYLHDLKFVHRDLACRNCMLREDLSVCIADFGLSRDVYEMQEYVLVHVDRLLPIRWMALEVIHKDSYTYKSDMWSYGIVLWELMTRGLIPYADMDSQQLAASLEKGDRLRKPEFCPDPLYDIMMSCWNRQPPMRPSASQALQSLQAITRMSLPSPVANPPYYNLLPPNNRTDIITAV